MSRPNKSERTISQVRSLPEGWKQVTVGAACTIRNDMRKPISTEERSKIQGEYPYYGPTGLLDRIDTYSLDGEFALIGEDGDHFLDYNTKPQTLLLSGQFNVNNHAHVIESSSLCLATWFYWYFRHRNLKEYLNRQGVGRYKLNKATLGHLPITIPPIAEQLGIVGTLNLWDSTIEKTERLIAAKKQLFQSNLRNVVGPAQSADKGSISLGEVFQERTETGLHSLPLLSITREEGVVRHDSTGRKDNSNEDKGKYLRILPGDIGYNTMRMWQGVSALSSLEGIVSPAYTICVPDKAKIDPRFAMYLFKHPKMIHEFYRHSQGLTSDTWNLKFHHFAQIKVSLPSMEEQKLLVAKLDECRSEIELLKRLLDAYQRQKRGLAQKLLTGGWRVGSSQP